MPVQDHSEALHGLAAALSVFRDETDEHANLSTFIIFLWIARKPGITVMEIVDRSGAPRSTVSRNVSYLMSARRKSGKDGIHEGYGLILDQNNPLDRRQTNLYLTPKGQRVANRLAAAFS
jgi:DNA-binding MarR family transcriptional regulator